jgi:hypothetical protein
MVMPAWEKKIGLKRRHAAAENKMLQQMRNVENAG